MGFRKQTALFAALLCVFGIAAESVYSQSLTGDSAPELTPVRRTAIVTADPDASLRFYRDVLGFAVEYDRYVSDSGTISLLAPGASEGRVIALRYGDTLGGSVGLFWTPGLPPQQPCVTPAQTGAVGIYAPGALWTAVHHKVPLLSVMHNNRAYHQEVMHVQRVAARRQRGVEGTAKIGNVFEDPPVDFAAMARSFGMWASGPIEDPNDLGPALAKAMDVVRQGEPALVDVVAQPR